MKPTIIRCLVTAVGTLAACAPTPSPIHTMDYAAAISRCDGKATAIEAISCMNAEQAPLFDGNEEVFERLAEIRLSVARAVDAGQITWPQAVANIQQVEELAHAQMEGAVEAHRQQWDGVAQALQQANENQLRRDAVNALSQPRWGSTTTCDSRAFGGGVRTTCN